MPLVNLNKRLDRLDRAARYGSRPRNKNFKKMWIKSFVILIILVLAIYMPLREVYSSGKRMIAGARAVNDAFKRENLDDVKKGLKDVKDADSSLNLSLNLLMWVRIIPYFGGFYSDALHFARASESELQASQILVEKLDPYKAELGFNGTPTPGQDKIAQFVKILDKILPEMDKVEPQLKKASDEVASVDTTKYPETFGKYRVRSQVETAKGFIQGAHYAVTQAKDALQVAPSALGQPDPKNYLMIFQNDKELRATGGFMTAYAFLKLDKGRVASSTSDDIYRLDEQLLQVCQNKICPLTPPAPIAKYLPEANGKPRTAWSMRDSNLSPDVPTSMRQFEKMYGYLGQGTPWDGVILIDTQVVEELIKITGPIEVYGTTYSAETDKRCNCPNVVYELEAYSQIIEKGEKDRKAILGTLMQQILARSLGSFSDKLPEFINTGVQLAQGKHMMFYMHDGNTQNALSKLDWTGEVKGYKYDYLAINDSNFAGGKSNLYVTENVNLTVDPKSSKHTLSIEYKNPQQYSSWLNGINRDYIRIYVPKGAKLTSSKGSDVQVTTIDEELGKTVFEAFIQVRPQNSRTISFEYTLPTNYTSSDYPLLIQKQPGTRDFDYTVKVDGKTQKFKLDADKDLKF